MPRKLLSFFLALSLVLVLGGCGDKAPSPVAGEEATTYTNQGYTLSVPNEYTDLLIIDRPSEGGKAGILFYVSEKASVEASKKLFHDQSLSGGFLFGIGRIDETAFRMGMCGGMLGTDVFAKDEQGNYYVRYHPTDVQLIREGDYTDADWAQWSTLCDWASVACDSFLVDNEGLTPYHRTYTDVDMFLSRLAYLDEDEFTLSRPGQEKPFVPSRELSRPFLDELMQATFTSVPLDKAPNCEYISLNLPNEQIRFDFFLADNGNANYVRQTWSDGMEALYLAIYDDGQLAGQSMLLWYIAAMQAQ